MRDLSKAARVMFGVNLAFAIGQGLYLFIMAAYARQLGATPAQYGAVMSLAQAVGVLAIIPGGIWADRYDARRLMILSWGMCLVTPLIYSWAPSWQWLTPGYLLLFGSFFANPAINVYITKSVPAEKLGATWGRINSAFPLGNIIGPAAGAVISRNFGMPALFRCTFVCWVVSFLLIFILPPVAAHEQPASPAGSGDGAAGGAPLPALRTAIRGVWPVFALFTAFFVLINCTNYVSLYLQDTRGLALSSLGWFGSVSSIGGFLLVPAIGRLRDKRGAHVALPTALGLAGLSYCALLSVSNLRLLGAAFALRGGESGVFALSNTEVAARSPREGMGRVFATFQVLTGIGATIGPYLGGAMYGADIRLPFLVVILGYACLALAARSVLCPVSR